MRALKRPERIEAAESEPMALRYCMRGVAAFRIFSRLCLLAVCLPVSAALAEDYVAVDLSTVTVASVLKPTVEHGGSLWRSQNSAVGYPHVLLDGAGEAYVECGAGSPVHYEANPCGSPKLQLRRLAPGPVTGTYVRAEQDGFRIVTFRIPAEQSGSQERKGYLEARLKYFDALASKRIAGGALFRHEITITRAELAQLAGTKPPSTQTTAMLPQPMGSQFEQTLDLLTGGRALSENLQLDRSLFPTEAAEQTVAIESISGVETPQMDWKPLLTEPPPTTDPLASLIPGDQYAVFVPSFAMFESMMDEAHGSLGEVVRGYEDRSEMANVRARYQAQLCLPLSDFARAVGPYVVTDLALTGSDPWFRTGTDLALLMNSKNPEILLTAVRARQDLCRSSVANATVSDGTVGGTPYHAVTTEDRALSSYAAIIRGAVVVTNSRVQLERLATLSTSGKPAIGALDEYRFFRTRYRLGEPDEAAFLVLPDPAIRRWVGPQWRIGESRRTRAAAFLGELQMAHADELMKAPVAERILTGGDIPAGLGAVSMGVNGVRSATYGTTGFLTPIAELSINKVSVQERTAYERFRNTYAAYWRGYFDPIAIQVKRTGTTLAVDATIMPLIAGTDYHFLREFTANGVIDALSGDPHADALAEITFSLDSTGALFQQQTAWMGMFLQGMANPLGWIGKSITVSLDPSPFWQALKSSPNPDQAMERLATQIPVELFIEVRDSLKLAAFLTGIRAFAEQGSPGLTRWDTLDYHGISYVRVGESKLSQVRSARSADRPEWAIYYAATPEALIVTLDESLLKRALDRLSHRSERTASVHEEFGAGSQLRGVLKRELVDSLQMFFGESYAELVQERCFSNLPVLNEWKRRFPDRDPIEVQRQLLNTTPVCQAGGEYRWNEKAHTVEATAVGHPGEPRGTKRTIPYLADTDALHFALGFEKDGLRAKLQLDRTSDAGSPTHQKCRRGRE